MTDRRILSMWAVCENCYASIEVKAHRDHPKRSMPPEAEWESAHLTCPVCGDWLNAEEIYYADDQEVQQ